MFGRYGRQSKTMNKTDKVWNLGGVKQQRLILGAVLALILATILYYSSQVRKDLRDLATANSDNIQWNLSQAEVEHYALQTVLLDAKQSLTPDLREVRLRFDVFYSRISTLNTGSLYSELRNLPAVRPHFAQLSAYLQNAAAILDGPDAGVLENLHLLSDNTALVRGDVREVALAGIRYFSELHDQRRDEISQTLISIAGLTAFLMFVMFLLLVALTILNRINQSRAAENEQTSARLEAIVKTSLDAVIVIDRFGQVLEYNGAAEGIFGYTYDEVVGKNMADLIIPDHLRAAHAAGMARYLKEGSRRVVGQGRVKLEAKRKSGELFPVELSIDTATSKRGELFVSYLRDITHEVEAENELLAARDSAIAGERSKAEFLAIMSHEMRTPLNGLLGTMELMGNTELSDKQNRYLQIMDKSGNMLLRHVNDVLDISRLEAGKLDLVASEFDLNALINEIVEGQSDSASNAGNEIRFMPDENSPRLAHGDPVRLRQLLLNLVGNAIKFTRNGHVSIETERLPGTDIVEIRVADTGVGIDEADLGRIFQDFTTIDTSYNRRTDGTGLGLSIARRMTTAMGGTIGVESELGEGSIFWIRLPIGAQLSDGKSGENGKNTLEHAPPRLDDAVEPADILLVEDNEINRLVVRDFLDDDGHRVIEAHDGREGIRFAESRKFDLILMDISMPEVDGTEAAQTIRDGAGPNKDTPIIALTAHALKQDFERFIASGMNDVVVKPVTRKALRFAVQTAKNNAFSDGPGTALSHAETDLINNDVLLEFQTDVGEDRFSGFLQTFLQESDELVEELDQAVENSVLGEDMAKKAHRLAGSSAMFGATRMRQKLVELEHAIRADDAAILAETNADLSEIWQKTRGHLNNLL